MFDEGLTETGWAAAVPSADLARRLAETDPVTLGDDDLIEVIAGYDRLASWAQAGQARAIAVFAGRRPPVDADDQGVSVSEYAADELSVALHLSRQAAGNRLHTAIEVSTRLPGTMHQWSAGAIDAVKVRSIADATRPLTSTQAADVEDRVFPRACRQTFGQLRAALARAVILADPGGAEHRHQEVHADRRVVVTPVGDGMAELWALMGAADATALYRRLTTLAKASADGRSMDARRADALAGFAHAAEPRTRAPALVEIGVAASTLLGADDQPAELAGYGPISAGEARRIAADGRWRRLLTDPATGVLLDYGRRTYAPPAPLADHVRARDRTCRFPTCRQPARSADLDHTVPYPTGPTSDTNLAVLCRHHHRLKHRAGWMVTQEAGAALGWTTPTGHGHVTRPPTFGVDAAATDSTAATEISAVSGTIAVAEDP